MRILVTGGSGFIGTNYIDFLIRDGHADVLNLDNKPPRNPAHNCLWMECDLLDKTRLKKIIIDFSPTHVVHLAAQCGVCKNLSDYAPNIAGVENLIEILEHCSALERVIFTSSTLVNKVGYMPQSDNDYNPPNLYGESKVQMEKIIRNNKLSYTWTIIRPISIWGEWFNKNDSFKKLFQFIYKGYYFHIGDGRSLKCIGYVGNTVYQIHKILSAPLEKVNRKTIYVADPPVDFYDFTNEIQKSLGAPSIPHLPLKVVKILAKMGDILKVIGWDSVPMSTQRFNNIRNPWLYDIQPILDITGQLPYSFKEGIKRTIKWLRDNGEL